MCGIVGILNLDKFPVSRVTLKKMTDMLIHRGPDREGFYIDKYLGFSHRRLAVIDLSLLANQPMLIEDKTLVITYNGEIYNFLELKSELESLGYTFRSKSDTEIVLKAFKEWDIKAINRFNGMFAFAIWDRKRERLILARDRYGIKPLYYYKKNNTFLFASEVKAFFPYPKFRKVLNKEVLLEYFTFQNVFTDSTLFKDVKLLPKGSILEIRLEPIKIMLLRYWDYNFNSKDLEKVSEVEIIQHLDKLFHQAVERQLVSDVEIGTYLSGGIDSASITAIAAKHFPYIKTFCIGFDKYSMSGLEASYDERQKAEYISYINKTEHYEMVLKSGDMERCIKDLVWYLEDLRVGQSYPNFYASKLAGSFVKVVLGGTGGDELFGGYPWRYFRAFRSATFEEYIDNYYLYWQRLLSNEEIKEIFSPIWKDFKDLNTIDIFKQVFKIPIKEVLSPEDYINLSLYFEANTFLHGLLLVEERLSIAYSLETRLPFLDNDFVDFAQKIPVKYKLKNINNILTIDENEFSKLKKFYLRSNDGKMILRKTLKRYVSDDIANQIKQGFTAPDELWFRGDSIDYVKKILFNKKSDIYNYLNYNAVIDIIQ